MLWINSPPNALSYGRDRPCPTDLAKDHIVKADNYSSLVDIEGVLLAHWPLHTHLILIKWSSTVVFMTVRVLSLSVVVNLKSLCHLRYTTMQLQLW